MHERTRAQAGSYGICWYCTACKTTKSIRHNSFFSKSKLTLQQWFVDIYQWLQEVCSTKLLATPIQLGGTGVVVQIDESLFRHKPKVSVIHYSITPPVQHMCNRFRMVVGDVPTVMFGCLGLQTHLSPLQLGTYRLYLTDLQLLSYQSSRLMCFQVPSYTLTCGVHIDVFRSRVYQMLPLMGL